MNRVLGGDQKPQSWVQAIQAYQRGKTHLSWNPTEVPPLTYVKQFDVSRKSREVDPVLMRHRDPKVEEKRREREDERLRAALNNARNRQVRAGQNYNIVNNRSHLGRPTREDPDPPRPTRHPDTRTPYDILNHVPRECVHSVALIYAEDASPEVMPQRDVTVEGGKKPYSHLKRDVDVLNNRFLENHDERMVEENKFVREQAQEKYCRTHDFDLIAGTYYDQKKEQDFLRTRETLMTLQGQAQQHRLPPSMRYGEGNEYDIINKESKGQVQQSEAAICLATRGINKRAHGRELHEKHIRQHQQVAAINKERALNRPSHQRHAERLRTGHDVISNQDFSGREGRLPPPPRARPPVSVWERLASQGICQGVGAGAGAKAEAGEESTGDAQETGVLLTGSEAADQAAKCSIDDGRGTRDGRERGSGTRSGRQPRNQGVDVDVTSGRRSGRGGNRGSNERGDEGKEERRMAAKAKQHGVPLLDMSRCPDDVDLD